MPGFSFSKRGMMMFAIVLPSASAWLYVFQNCSVTTFVFDAADAEPVLARPNITPPNTSVEHAVSSLTDVPVLPLMYFLTLMIIHHFLFSWAQVALPHVVASIL